MRKIGIISMYYNSKNYGGLLQSYALVKTISKLGKDSEQICWQYLINNGEKAQSTKKNILKKLIRKPYYLIKRVLNSLLRVSINNKIKKRNLLLKKFEETIPHSDIVYDRNTIKNACENYERFITGSDQVWNLDWYNQEYFLDFVPNDFFKASYAASMPDVNISKEQENLLKRHLHSFNMISVREKETQKFLQELCGKNVKWVIDPTLLLEQDDWDEICDKRIVSEKYIFCYFLGDSEENRKIANEFAKETNLKIVTIPYLSGINNKNSSFGDIKLFDISCEQFLSLIKYAEYVITDSFHAVVFSNIYKTKYFVFRRSKTENMSSRITSILELLNAEERFCVEQSATVKYMIQLKEKNIDNFQEKFLEAKDESILYLKEMISDLEEI